jgi:hypothetical protein
MEEWSAGAAADEQFEELETNIFDGFLTEFLTELNVNYWHELDTLPNETWRRLEDGIRDVAEPMRIQFRFNSPVTKLIDSFVYAVCWALRGYLSGPFPEGHLAARLDGVFNLVHDVILSLYADLRTEMVVANHSAHTIQKHWRECNVNPVYMACRHRLQRESEDFQTLLENRDAY